MKIREKHLVTKTPILSYLLAVFCSINLTMLQAQIPIKNGVFGQNYNRSSVIGTNTATGGQLENYWPQISTSLPRFIRYGGIEVDLLCDENTVTDYATKVQALRIRGIEPIIQVPLNAAKHAAISDAAMYAGQIVKNVNDQLILNGYLPVTWWSISNEPEGKGFTTSTAAVDIHDYIVEFSNSMRGQGYTIKIMGPELWDFDNYNHGTGNINALIDKLTDKNAPSTYILPYIDVFTFHFYPFGNEGVAPNNGIPSPTRSNVIQVLNQSITVTGGFSSTPIGTSISYLKARILNCPAPDNQVGIGITEANICYKNDVYPTDSYNVTDDTKSGNGANSFIAGQFNSELMSICMEKGIDFLNFWSIVEGCNSSNVSICGSGNIDNNTNIGYIDNVSGDRKSAYWHFWLMSRNFSGNFYKGVAQTGKGDIKAFASKGCGGINIMLLNQNNTSTYSSLNKYRINLNGTMPATSSNEIGIRLGATGNSMTNATNLLVPTSNETTTLFKLDPCGNPIGYYTYSNTSTAGPVFTRVGRLIGPLCACSYAQRCLQDTSVTQPPHYLSGNTLIVDSAYIGDGLHVPSGVTLHIQNALVTFGSRAALEVTGSGRIIITNSVLQGCDGRQWAGIRYDGRGDSARLYIDSTTIRGASTPIVAKGNEVTITNSAFYDGITAIILDSAGGFKITGNSFTGFINAINTTRCYPKPGTVSGSSFADISENFFADITNGITCSHDNHSKLNINCNEFYHYTGFAVKTTACTLKNQGDSSSGAGNVFINGSALLNSKFSHNGNNMVYYTDPSHPFTLVSGLGMNATTTLAVADGCGAARFIAPEESTAESIPERSAGILSTVPNPNNGLATIYYNLGKSQSIGEIWITNLFGEVISRYMVTASSDKMEIDCTSLPNGIYFTSLITGGKISSCKKMIIAK